MIFNLQLFHFSCSFCKKTNKMECSHIIALLQIKIAQIIFAEHFFRTLATEQRFAENSTPRHLLAFLSSWQKNVWNAGICSRTPIALLPASSRGENIWNVSHSEPQRFYALRIRKIHQFEVSHEIFALSMNKLFSFDKNIHFCDLPSQPATKNFNRSQI